MLWVHSENPKEWRQVSRSTVLGKWREIKKRMYQAYLEEQNDDIPF